VFEKLGALPPWLAEAFKLLTLAPASAALNGPKDRLGGQRHEHRFGLAKPTLLF